MANDESERLLVEIGRLLAEGIAYPLDGILLYARLGRNWVAPSIFQNLGEHVLYRWSELEALDDALLALWEAQDSDDRWAEIEYVVRDGMFTVNYVFPDAIDPEEEPLDRRDRVIRRHFGDKQVVYPQFPPDDDVGVYTLD